MTGTNPDRKEPLLKRDLGRFHDRSYQHRELATARGALVSPVLQRVYFLYRSAMGTRGTIAPADVLKVLSAGFIVGKLPNEIDEAVVGVGREHGGKVLVLVSLTVGNIRL